MIAFAARPNEEGAAPLTLVLTRDTLEHGLTVERFADRQLAGLARQLPRFVLIAKTSRTVAGRAAVDVSFCWYAGSSTMHQRIVSFAGEGGQIFMLTANAYEVAAAELHTSMERILASVTLPTWS